MESEDKLKLSFSSAEEMLEMIVSGVDLYNPESGEYVFLYSDSGSICVYNLTKEEADVLSAEDEYWGAYLGLGGRIIDSLSSEFYKEGDPTPLDFCKLRFADKNWFRTADWNNTT